MPPATLPSTQRRAVPPWLSSIGRLIVRIRTAPVRLALWCFRSLKPHFPVRIRAGNLYHLYPEDRKFLRTLKARGVAVDIVYDVGASTGVWSGRMSYLLPKTRFHLFEPLAEQVEHYRHDLAERLPLMPALTLHTIALGASNGQAEFCVADDGYGSSMLDRGQIPEVSDRVGVPLRRLDDYVAELGLPPPDVIKLDCQGSEPAVLAGARGCLGSARAVIIETWLERGYGAETPLLPEIVELLRREGFALVGFGEMAVEKGHVYGMDAYFLDETLAGS